MSYIYVWRNNWFHFIMVFGSHSFNDLSSHLYSKML